MDTTLHNNAMLNGLNSGQYYFSVAPYGVTSFFEENYVNSPAEQFNKNLGGRAWLMKLFSMRYFVGREGEVPYGFVPYETEVGLPEGIGIYEDTSALPLVYSYDSYIREEEFENLDPARRQEAMLWGVVLEESCLPESEPEYHSQEVGWKLVESDGVQLEEDGILVKKNGGTCVLEIDGRENCETYVAFSGLRYEGVARTNRVLFENAYMTEGRITAQTDRADGTVQQSIDLRSPQSRFQGSRGDYLLNLGYQEDKVTRVTLSFGNRGKYTFESMDVYCQKMDMLNELASRLQEESVTGFAAEENTLKCRVDIDQDKALVFSIPYSTGWSVVVDGQEAEVKQANGLFLGVELREGYHEIEFTYRTPYIQTGAILTITAVVFTGGMYWYKRKKGCTCNKIMF